MSAALWKYPQLNARIGFLFRWKDFSYWVKVGLNEKLKLCKGTLFFDVLSLNLVDL